MRKILLIGFAPILLALIRCTPCRRHCDGDVCEESGTCPLEETPVSPGFEPDAGEDADASDGAVGDGSPGDCPSTEPVEGTACSEPGLACGGWGSFSCPETATCTPEGQWWIGCPGLAFGGDAGMCGCPHPTD
jgi:hypothetical protein